MLETWTEGGFDADAEVLGDPGVRPARGREPEHLALPGRQVEDRQRVVLGRAPGLTTDRLAGERDPGHSRQPLDVRQERPGVEAPEPVRRLAQRLADGLPVRARREARLRESIAGVRRDVRALDPLPGLDRPKPRRRAAARGRRDPRPLALGVREHRPRPVAPRPERRVRLPLHDRGDLREPRLGRPHTLDILTCA